MRSSAYSAADLARRLSFALPAIAAFALAFALAGCKTEHKIETVSKVDTTSKVEIEIKPIYARIDVYLKVDKELDSFFDFEETIQPVVKPEGEKKSDAGSPQNRGA